MGTPADIIILGAGPAGYSAAICARLAGLRPVLLEMEQSRKRQPGETLHPGIEPILKQLGVWKQFYQRGFHRHRGIWHEKPNYPRRFVPYGSGEEGPWLGFQVDRIEFHEILRTRLIELGGIIQPAKHLDGVVETKARVSGILVDGRELKADFLLDATGRRCWLAGELGLMPERKPSMQRVRFGWTKDTAKALQGQPLFRERINGWDWLAPLGGGRYAWAELRRGTASRGIDFTWQIRRECAGPGYFLLGDAACLMDPSAANGVLRALMSGIYAIHLIDACGQDASLFRQAIFGYRNWVGQTFDRAWAQSTAISAGA